MTISQQNSMKNTNCYAILTRWCYNAGMIVPDPERLKRAEERRKTMTIRRVSQEESDVDFDPVFGAETFALR